MSDAALPTDAIPSAPAPSVGDPATVGDATVVDLARKGPAGTAKVKIDRGQNPLTAMGEQERMRLIIRVLCELVAYGDVDGEQHAAAS